MRTRHGLVMVLALAGCNSAGRGGPFIAVSDDGGGAVDLAEIEMQMKPMPDVGVDGAFIGDYPAGPYGYVIGSVIENLALVGQTDDNHDGVIDPGDTIKAIHLADYFHDQSRQALVILVEAEWCNPCRMEQAGDVALYQQYRGAGDHVAFLEALIQDKNGKPATMATVDSWAGTFHIPFDMAADPTVALGPYYNIAAFPMQMVIRTKDMTIAWQNNGLASDQLKLQIDDVLAGK